MKSVKVIAPATVANVSCGFDILGFAVDHPGDVVIMTLKDSPGVTISDIVGDGGRLPRESAKNTASVAVQAFLDSIGSKQGVDIVLHKNLPLGSGMGSSAASAVAALVGINHLLGNPKSRAEMVPFAMEAERIACGSAHADNVAPSLLGGFVLIRDYNPLDVIKIASPEHLYCTLVHPQIEVKTEDSRRVLKTVIPLKDALTQAGNVAGLVTGLMTSDYDLIKRCIKDVIAEPVRSVFIPGYDEIKEAAMVAGALGCGISGSGPTMYALSSEPKIAEKIGEAMQLGFLKYHLKSEVHVSKVNQEGAKIIQ
ncbi:MAG TPA: homoserine kinase [Cyclobacteriaceae bacterium]|nr:homoserine kinase [Cyclobacteriaceae bacterium]